MGKSKQKKFRAERPKPTGLPSVKDCEEELNENPEVSSSAIQNIIDKLNSPVEEERECSCTTIATIVSQPTAIRKLMQNNIVKILAPYIVDKNHQLRVKALGALRNLSVDGGEDVCNEMVRKDILTPLVALFHEYGVGWTPDKPVGKRETNLKSEIFTEAVNILWNLCESSDEAVDVFNRENLVTYLWPCLQHSVYGVNTAVTVAHCLHTVTEDNTHIAKTCQSPDYIGLLETLIGQSQDSSDQVLLRSLATGIMVNVCSGQISNVSGNVMSAIITTMSEILSLDALTVLHAAAVEVTESMNGDIQTDDRVAEDEINTNQKSQKLKDVENILCSQQVVLEIVANLCCSDGDEWEDLESSESSCDDMPVDAEMEDNSQDNDIFSPLCIPSEVQTVIKEQDIFSKVLLKAQPVNLQNDVERLKQKSILESFLRLQTNALLCINNLVNSLDSKALGGIDNLHVIWQGLVQLTTSQEALQNGSMLEAITSAIRAVTQKLAELQSPKLLEVSPGDLQTFFRMCQQCPLKEVRVNVVRVVSTMGCVYAKSTEIHPALKSIGSFLLDVSSKDNELWVVAEALDCIFDVFGEDHLDPLDKEIGLTDRLKQLLPVLKAKINSGRKNLGEHYPVISTAKTNLVRFIKYKTSLHHS